MLDFSVKVDPRSKAMLVHMKRKWDKTVVLGTLKELSLYVQRETKIAAPVNLGLLRKSLAVEYDEVVTMHSATGSVYSELEYAEIANDGRGPGGIPSATPKSEDPVRRWVQLKLKPSAKDLDRVTYFVRKKIAEKGYKGKKFMEAGVAKGDRMATRIANRQIAKFDRETK